MPRAGMYAKILRMIFHGLIKDKERMEDLMKKSQTNCTAIRSTKLTNVPKTGKVQAGQNFTPKGLFPSISRVDVAGFMLGQLPKKEYVNQAVNISKGKD